MMLNGLLNELIKFSQKVKDLGVEITYKKELTIKPAIKETEVKSGHLHRNKELLRNILVHQSSKIAQELRKLFSLEEITDTEIDVSALDSLFSEYADEEVNSVELVKYTRRRI